jgi:hypothetical protein
VKRFFPIALFSVLAVLWAAGTVKADVLGPDSSGAVGFNLDASTTDGNEQIFGTPVTATSDGEVTKITAYINATTAAHQNPKYYAQCALYEADTGSTWTLVATTVEHTYCGAGCDYTLTYSGWTDFTFASNPTITSGTDYLIVAWGRQTVSAGAGLFIRLLATVHVGATYYQKTGTYTSGYPDPLTSLSSGSNYDPPIYLTYTPTAAGKQPHRRRKLIEEQL